MRTLWRLSAILGCCILAFGCSEKDRGYWREGARGQLLTNPTAPFILLILEATEEEQPPPPVPVTPRNSREQKLKRKAQVLVQEARLGSPKAQYELGQTL